MQDGFLEAMSAGLSETELAGGEAEADAYRNEVADSVTSLLADMENSTYINEDGVAFVNADVVGVIGAMLAQRGVVAALKASILNDEESLNVAAVYAEAATICNVTARIVTGTPIDD